MVRNKGYTPMQQFSALRSHYGGTHWKIRPNGFTWWYNVTPTPLSDTYTLKIVYNKSHLPNTFVTSPQPLPLAKGAKRLPHTYNSKQQKLCLFKPSNREWNSHMLISDTIFHWALEWLFFYEEWVFSGKWYGGGHGNWDSSFEEETKQYDNE